MTMSGDINKKYARDDNGSLRPIWPAMAMVAVMGASIPLGYALHSYFTGPRADLKLRGYSGISFQKTASTEPCGKDFPIALNFTAATRFGKPVSGTYCGSQLFGHRIHLNRDIAESAPSTP